MNIQLRFFAGIRETLGCATDTVVFPNDVTTVGAARRFLAARGGVWATALDDGRSVRVAYNQQMADAGTPIADGGELAFFPPVTGG